MFELEDLKLIKSNHSKDVWHFPAVGKEWFCINLKKDQIAGEHYHKGLYPNKNPEVLILLSGKLECYFKDVKSDKEETVIVDAPKLIKIMPYVYHSTKALEESLFIEPFNPRSALDKFEL